MLEGNRHFRAGLQGVQITFLAIDHDLRVLTGAQLILMVRLVRNDDLIVLHLGDFALDQRHVVTFGSAVPGRAFAAAVSVVAIPLFGAVDVAVPVSRTPVGGRCDLLVPLVTALAAAKVDRHHLAGTNVDLLVVLHLAAVLHPGGLDVVLVRLAFFQGRRLEQAIRALLLGRLTFKENLGIATGQPHAHRRDVVTSFRRIVERLDIPRRARHLGVTRRVVGAVAVVRGRIGGVGVGCRITVAVPVPIVPRREIASVVAAGIRIAVTVARTITVTAIPAAVTTIPAAITAVPATITTFPAATSTASLRLG